MPARLRIAILNHHPQAGEKPLYLYVIVHFLLSRFIDKEGNGVVFTRELLAQFAGQEQALRNDKFAAQQVIDDFNANCMPGEWTNWSSIGKARVLKSLPLRPEVLEVARECKYKGLRGGMCYIETGEKVSREDVAKLNKRKRHNYHPAVPQMEPVLDYLNNLPSTLFEGLDFKSKREVAIYREKASEETLRALLEIETDPQPFYAATKNTARLYAVGSSFLGLPREVRDALLPRDWISVDLRACQLAVAAKDWDIPTLHEFLLSGKSIWKELAGWIEMDYDEKVKNLGSVDISLAKSIVRQAKLDASCRVKVPVG